MKRALFFLAAVAVLCGPVAALAQDDQYAQSQPTQQSQPQQQNMNQSTTPDQTTPSNTNNYNNTTTTTTTDQTQTGTDQTKDTSMPRTASPLPLVGSAGLLSLVSGLWLSRRRK